MKNVFWVREYGEANKKVIFLFAGWKYRSHMILPVARLFAAHGYRCVVYWYDVGIFSPNHSQTREEILKVCDSALVRAGELAQQGKEIYAICGASLGSVCAVKVANALPQARKVILNTTGADVAGSVWEWDVSLNKGFKQNLLDQGLDLDKLARSWKAISPIHNIDNFAGKQVLVYLAAKDKITPYRLGQELVAGMREKGAVCEVVLNRHLSHAGANLYNFARPSKYLTFLKQTEEARA
jgi:hypothetical protein